MATSTTVHVVVSVIGIGGALSLVVLAVALVARYTKRLDGPWRTIWVVTAATALYFNVFVLIVQAFLKVPALRAMAPTQSEPPFAIAQLGALALFVVLTIAAARKFRVEPEQVHERTHV